MELNKENVVTMARSESQHMRTNSGDAVFLFNYEGLLRFADKLISRIKMPDGSPPWGQYQEPVSSEAVTKGLDNTAFGWFANQMGFTSQADIEALNKTAMKGFFNLQNKGLPQQQGLPKPLNLDQQFTGLTVEGLNMLLQELNACKDDNKRLVNELAKEKAWGVQFKEESEKTIEKYKTAFDALREEIRKERSVSFDLIQWIMCSRDKLIRGNTVVEVCKKFFDHVYGKGNHGYR